MTPLPPIQYLSECLEISDSSVTGLRWKLRPRSHFKTSRGWKISLTRDLGAEAGSKGKSGDGSVFFTVKINQITFMAHRIVYALHHGRDPYPLEVDHINRNPLDNRPENLRVATRSENASNKGIQANNTSGRRGVTFCRKTGKWQAQIGHNGKCIFLGRHETQEDAYRARLSAEKQIHGEFSPAV